MSKSHPTKSSFSDTSVYTAEEVETLVYELLAVSILEILPEDTLLALDQAVSGTDEAFDAFLKEHVPNMQTMLEEAVQTLALPEGTW